MTLPLLYCARHGQTEWSLVGKHTGRTDIPLTAEGEAQARHLGERLRGLTVASVLTSPLIRAARTCELAGFAGAGLEPDLVEWDYGAYEGRRTVDIRKERPGWYLFRDGCPNGETAADVGVRADRLIARVRAIDGDVLIFSSAHMLRVLAARWLGLPPADARLFTLETASLSVLGYEHGLDQPVIRRWNETGRAG